MQGTKHLMSPENENETADVKQCDSNKISNCSGDETDVVTDYDPSNK